MDKGAARCGGDSFFSTAYGEIGIAVVACILWVAVVGSEFDGDGLSVYIGKIDTYGGPIFPVVDGRGSAGGTSVPSQ